MNDDTTDNTQTPDDQWPGGDSPMTDAQRVYLDALAVQTGEPTPSDKLTKAEANLKIDELQAEAGLDDADTIAEQEETEPVGAQDRVNTGDYDSQDMESDIHQ